uniref:Fe2OG dioxygenase domain-containing protein n=1 Tax=Kalanchoe fedtschenkoi TaxID=63787 RepID=A0A7N0RCR3_KALFE
MAKPANLPIIDLSSSDLEHSAKSIRQACMEYGFFYLVNHGVGEELLDRVFSESRKFFALPLEEKMKLARKNHRGYTPLYAENLNPSASSRGDSKESFYIGPLEDDSVQCKLNQWPLEDGAASWKCTMETYYEHVLDAGKRLISLIAQALNVEQDFFGKVGATDDPNGFLRLLHYPGVLEVSDEERYGASAHSDYGMITLLATDGVGGLQVCREKSSHPQIWEDVLSLKGAFIVNIGDMLERWTNCLFRWLFSWILTQTAWLSA